MRKLLLLLLLLVSHVSFGQWNWPVQVNTFMEPYANNYLSYFSDQNNHLQALVTLTDQNATSVPAKLRIRMEGNGWWLETIPEPNSIPALSLEPFVSNIITGLDLQPYFYESNLVKSSASLDLNNLPEGQVELCVEVYGVGGPLTTIGGNQCTYFNIERLQPPQFFPLACGTTLDTNLMFHTFQWTPATGFTPLIGTDIEYTYSLYEVVDPNNYAIQVSNQIGLIEQIVTPFQTIQINLFDLNLQVGKKYIWQVRAVVYDNGIPRQMVDNDGFSSICEFNFGEAQTLEETLVDGLEIVLDAQANTQYKGTASWTVTDNTPGSGLSTYERYFIEYRLQPENTHPNPSWHYDTVTALNKLIYQLAPETTYEVRVSGMAGSFTSDPTPIVAFTTPAAVDYACGDEQMPFRPNNYTPNENIRVGDQVQIGQFMMNITEAIPQYEAGRYGGQGWIPVEFLGGARANVVFENILIDNEYVVRDGRVDVTTDGVDAWLHEQLQDFVDPIYVDGTVDSAWVDTTAGVAWVVIDGVQHDFVFDPPDYPIVIHDDSGMAWTIYPNGTITVEGYLDPSNDHLDVSADSVAVFAQYAGEVFGFDAKEHMEWHENYQVIQLPDSTYYFVANKSIGKDEPDTVSITIPGSGTPVFKLDDQTVLNASTFGGSTGGGQSTGGTTYSLSIPAISSTGAHTIYVYNNQNQRLGKLNLHVFKKKEREVIVVPIANVSVSEMQLKAKLDQTLGGANLDISVTVAPQWNDSTFTTTKSIALPENLTLMTDYSQDMRDLRDAYFSDTSVQKNSNAYYLFVIPEFDDANTDGYMVKGKALGFVKGNNYQTYAHELAHGMGGLGHTWKFNGPAQGSTDNLMDYSTGNNVNLTKAQWKELRDFDVAPSMWDDVEDEQSYTIGLSEISSLSNPDGTYTFFRVNGKYITLPPNTQSVSFSTLDRMFEQFNRSETSFTAPVGSIIGFSDSQGTTFITDETGVFKALNTYTNNTVGTATYQDTLSAIAQPTSAITSLFSPTEGDSVIQYFFKANSTIPITEPDDFSGLTLDNLVVFEQPNANRNQTIFQYIASQKTNEAGAVSVLKPLTGFKFGNGNSPVAIYGELDSVVLNLNSTQVFTQMVDGQSTFTEWLKFLSLINAPSDYYQAFGHCVNNTILAEWQRQEEEGQFYLDSLSQQYETPSSTIIDQSAIQQNFDDYNFDHVTTILDIYQESLNLNDAVIANAIQATYTEQNSTQLTDLKNTLSYGTHSQIITTLLSTEKCVLYGLNAQERADAIDNLVQEDAGWYLILPILETIPDEDRSVQEVQLLSHLRSNNAEVLQSFTSQLAEWFEFGEDIDLERASEIIAVYAQFLAKRRSSFPESTNSLTQDFVSEAVPSQIPYTYSVEYPFRDIPIVIGSEGSETIDLGKFDGVGGIDQNNYKLRIEVLPGHPEFPLTLLPNGNIQVTQSLVIKEVPWEAQIQNVGSSINSNLLLVINQTYEIDPFDRVDIFYGRNFAHLGKDEGDFEAVDGMTALFLQQEIDNEDFNQNVRRAVDVVEIGMAISALMTAPFTGGGSILLYAEVAAGISGAIDLMIANQENQMTTTQLQEASYLEEWQDIKGQLDLALAGTGISGIGAATASSTYRLIRPNSLPGAGSTTPLRSTKHLILAKSLRKSVKLTNASDNVSDALVLQKSQALKKAFRTGSMVDQSLFEGTQMITGSFIHLSSSVPTTLASNTLQALNSFVSDQTFIQFDSQPYVIQSPTSFISETGNNMYDMVIDNNLYFKYDLNSGRILMCNANDGTYHAFVQEYPLWSPPSGANVNDAVEQHMIQQADKLKTLSGLNGSISFTIRGVNYSTNTSKVTTGLGRMNDINLLKAELGDFKNKDLGEVIGGFNILNRPDNMFANGYVDWWINHNKPWILRAIQREDDFYLCSDYLLLDELLTVEYLGAEVPTITAYELRELKEAGKKPLNVNTIDWQNICEYITEMEDNNMFTM